MKKRLNEKIENFNNLDAQAIIDPVTAEAIKDSEKNDSIKDIIKKSKNKRVLGIKSDKFELSESLFESFPSDTDIFKGMFEDACDELNVYNQYIDKFNVFRDLDTDEVVGSVDVEVENDFLDDLSIDAQYLDRNEITEKLKQFIEMHLNMLSESLLKEANLNKMSADGKTAKGRIDGRKNRTKTTKEDRIESKDLWSRVHDALAPLGNITPDMKKIRTSDQDVGYAWTNMGIKGNNITITAPTKDELAYAKKVADFYGLECKIYPTGKQAGTNSTYTAEVVIPEDRVHEQPAKKKRK